MLQDVVILIILAHLPQGNTLTRRAESLERNGQRSEESNSADGSQNKKNIFLVKLHWENEGFIMKPDMTL